MYNPLIKLFESNSSAKLNKLPRLVNKVLKRIFLLFTFPLSKPFFVLKALCNSLDMHADERTNISQFLRVACNEQSLPLTFDQISAGNSGSIEIPRIPSGMRPTVDFAPWVLWLFFAYPLIWVFCLLLNGVKLSVRFLGWMLIADARGDLISCGNCELVIR